MKAHLVIAAVVGAVLAVPPLSATAAGADLGAATAGSLAVSASTADAPQPGGLEAPAQETAGLSAASALAPASSDFSSERALILQQTNKLRADNGLPPLRLNSALNDIAQDWSMQQARAMTMSHRPNFTALYPAGWSRAAENVAAGYSPSSVVSAWANSPGHRANLLSSNTDIGIGVAMHPNGRIYYTQNFGRYTTTPPTPPGDVTRIAGSDRYSTSAQISARAFPGGASTVYVASGANFPDALAAAALAGAADGPLLLVTPGSVPSVILNELRRLRPDRIVVAGGPTVISNSVLTTLRTVSPVVSRVHGPDRYATSRALALDAYGQSGASSVYLATGAGFADALAAGPAAASVDAPVLLLNGSLATIDDETLAAIRALGARTVVIAGSAAVVSAGIESSLRALGFTVQRYAGADRYATASAIAAAHFPDAASGFVATGSGFADALSGGAAAGALGAPLFTSKTSCVPRSAHTALRNQNPDAVVLLGGLGVLLPTVAGFYRC